jgi:hypothetical protein
MDGDFSHKTGKLITFIITAISMAIAFILIPFFPSPLPFIVAFLVAYAVYKDNPYGAIGGSVIIALGLFYHLSRIGFFQLMKSPLKNTLLMALLFAPFIICPAILKNNLQIIAMDMGIIAVSFLFFKQTFYLAIPLILIFTTIYKGKGVVFTLIYYTFISLPLQVMQYLKTYSEVSVPPLYTPLNLIYSDIQTSMSTVSLDEILKVLNTITGIVPPDVIINGERAAFASFINSLPGMVMFFMIMSGLISVIAILNMRLPDPISGSAIPGRYVNMLVYIIPIFAAAITNMVFFLAIDTLQAPLSFQASVNRPILISSTMFTVLFSAPVSFSKYIVDLKEVRDSRTEEIQRKSKEYLEKIKDYMYTINNLGNSIPENFIDIKTKMQIAQDELKEINKGSKDKQLDLQNIDTKLRRLFGDLTEDMKNFETQLDVAFKDYYVKIKFEYLEAVSEIHELGIEVNAPEIPKMNHNDALSIKVENINQIINSGRILVKELIETSDKIYEIISGLFEPNLPRDSATLQISRQKIEEDEPWVIINAILISLKNWEKQFSSDILNATKPINDSVDTIIQLSRRKNSLKPLLGDKYELIDQLSKQVTEKRFNEKDENLKVLKVILIRDTILSTVNVVSKIIGLLYYHIQDLEFNINLLLPREDYEWNRNMTLTERMNQSLQVLNKYEEYDIDEIVNHLYRVLSYIDEAVDTIEYYNERREMLLHYPVFKKKIGRLLSEKNFVTIRDIGVAEKYGIEYLKIFHRTTYSPLLLDESMNVITRNPDA